MTIRGVFGCIADLCRTEGALKFKCNTWSICNDPNKERQTIIDTSDWPLKPADNTIHLCLNNISKTASCGIENTMLHEMLHRCGAGNHPSNDETAPSTIANQCLNQSNCAMTAWTPPKGII